MSDSPFTTHPVTVARDLLGPTDDRENVSPEYERGVVELTATLLGMPMGHADVVAAALGVADYRRYDY